MLATAHEEILDFVEDETNKDIDLTERNAIRAEIQKPNSNVRLLWPYNPVQPERWELGSSDSSLGETVKEYNLLRDDVDQAGTFYPSSFEFVDFLPGYSRPVPGSEYRCLPSRYIPHHHKR